MSPLYSLTYETLDGRIVPMSNHREQILLIVNTASQCGFTPQYQGLQRLYESFGPDRFMVIGFPCNQFLHQEPATEEDIYRFCEMNFGVTFPLTKKTDVNGSNAHPIFRFLKEAAPGFAGSRSIKWNFTKFLVSAGATSVLRFAPRTPPEQLIPAIKEFLHE